MPVVGAEPARGTHELAFGPRARCRLAREGLDHLGMDVTLKAVFVTQRLHDVIDPEIGVATEADDLQDGLASG